ncbi:hypothetical protein LA6_002195 [Marinibacterium anthonyi]|nr:hypothetical protein LA6_002195 [Marinibacterium anthonyi]
MQIIATEEHRVTREVAEAWHKLGLDRRDPGVACHLVAEIEARLIDLSDARIGLMDDVGITAELKVLMEARTSLSAAKTPVPEVVTHVLEGGAEGSRIA